MVSLWYNIKHRETVLLKRRKIGKIWLGYERTIAIDKERGTATSETIE